MKEEKTPKEVLLSKLEDLYDEAIRALNLWEEAEDAYPEEAIFSEDYPFTESFDEVVYKIGKWITTSNDSLISKD